MKKKTIALTVGIIIAVGVLLSSCYAETVTINMTPTDSNSTHE